MRLLPLSLTAAFILVAAACGANPDASEVAAAGASLEAAGSARVETVGRLSVVGADAETFEFRSTAIVDYVNDRREDREESSGCRTIRVGDLTYAELPSGGGFPAGKHWVEIGGEAVESEALFEQSQKQETDEEGGMTASMIVFGVVDPTPHDYLGYLRASGEPERVGEEDVRGVPTTHYRGEVDVRNRIEADLETEGWKAANVESYLEGIQETARQIDLWVDAEGLARRVVATDRSPGAEVGMTGDWVTTTEYFDFGLGTDIRPPPAAEVLESEEWQRITDEQMQRRLDEYRDEIDDGITPLPGTFAPSATSDSDSDSAESSCRR